MWDNEDAVCGIKYNGTPYYFLKNLQGDVIAITDDNGAVVARYSYDAWGVPTVVSDATAIGIATVNPFRYRGYYYDSETQLYYLQSRYYNPASARWLSMEPNAYCGLFDSEADLLGYNTYVYCANTPISYKDSNGESILGVLIGIGVGALIGALAGWGYAKYFNIPKDKTWKYILGGALIGGILGGCIGYAIGAGSGAVLWSGEGMSKAAAAFAKKNG